MQGKARIALMVAACGGISGMAQAQLSSSDGYVVNGSGATLVENFLRAPASSNDFIDVDGDGTAGSLGSFFVDQLAPQGPFGTAGQELQIHYRLVGSGNGIDELDLLGDQFYDFAGSGSGPFAGGQGTVAFAPAAIWNREDLVISSMLQGIGNPSFVAGTRNYAFASGAGQYQAADPSAFTGLPDAGFIMDFASHDVSVFYFQVVNPGAGAQSPLRVPGQSGYGDNPVESVNRDGSPAGRTNQLVVLSKSDTNTASPTAGQTIFDFPTAIVPVGAFVNKGVGLEEIDCSDLRHLTATGRRLVGENLMKINRDSGSGTRNAFANGIGLDPSFARGENIGPRSNSSSEDVLGPNFDPSHKGGSTRVDETVASHRLAVGHSGAERGVGSTLFARERIDVLGIRYDLQGDLSEFYRPDFDNILTGRYQTIGEYALSALGDPRNAPANLGGWGWAAGETGASPFVDAMGNPTPAPANPAVSAFLNNIFRSISEFVTVPGGFDTEFMPGEWLADNLFLVAGPDMAQSNQAFATTGQPIELTTNPNQNANLRSFYVGDPGQLFKDPGFAAFDSSNYGIVPHRDDNATGYDDGSTTGDYTDQGGNTVLRSDLRASSEVAFVLTARNGIAFDFNGDGVRSTADAIEMLRAWEALAAGDRLLWSAPNGSGPLAGEPGTDAVIEILGDATGDGNFRRDDIRYWADGLVLTTAAGLDVLPVAGSDTNADNEIDTFVMGDGTVDATLDRTAGYAALDNAWDTLGNGNNFFGTALGTGATYQPGDSRADIAGGGYGATPGFVLQDNYTPDAFGTRDVASSRVDGVVDLADIDYVCQNFGDWADLEAAVAIDLSADMDGDLFVDAEDVRVIAEDILGTRIGDLNLDGAVDGNDVMILNSNLGSGSLYSQGDINCDGVVDSADTQAMLCLQVDQNGDGSLNNTDINLFVNNFLTSMPAADLNGDGIYNNSDINLFVSNFLNPACQ